MVKIAKQHILDQEEMRAIYASALIETAHEDERVISINCDLSSSMGTVAFAKEFPDRSFNVGIQEANGCGVAAGLAVTGFVPFFHTFAVFASRRVCDQIFQSCAYAGLNVKIVGGDAGVSATYNGGTHMAFEDIGVLRSIPTITIVEATDGVMMRKLVPMVKDIQGVVYMRTIRKQAVTVYEEGSEFAIGKAAIVREGEDVTVIACGIMVAKALEAADILQREGISVRVVDMFTIKPIDVDCVLECAMKTGAIVTAENHNIIGGLGSAVAEVLSEHAPVIMSRVGARDQFGEVGDVDYLIERFGLTAEHICDHVRKINKKKAK